MPRLSEDWLAVLIGGVLLAVCLGATLAAGGDASPLKPYLATPGGWSASPLEAGDGRWLGIGGAALALLVAFAAATDCVKRFLPAFAGVFALALVAYTLEKQQTLGYWGLAYPLWAIVIGLAISNTVGTPAWLRPAVRTELYMKTGLVLLGAEVLLSKLVALGPPGIAVAWVVTPIVLCTTFWFGQRVLRMESPSLNMVVSADMSVCGVSAAIATAAACRAKKEELTLAIGLSMAFTVVMMLVMPPAIRAMGLSPAVGGAWIGGTIDSTGAVGAAGALLSGDGDDTALVTATTIKMIQNVLIGVVAFAVATYWVTVVDRRASEDDTTEASRRREPAEGLEDQDAQPAREPSPDSRRGLTGDRGAAVARGFVEVWRRFPRFILGFLAASVVFSLLKEWHPQGDVLVDATISGSTKTLRGWCFALAFASIGLETDFRRLAGPLRSGKPLVLYVCGQSLNLALTLAMASLMFGRTTPAETEANASAELPRPSATERIADAGVDPAAMFYTDHPRNWGETEAPR